MDTDFSIRELTLKDMIDSTEFRAFIADKLGNNLFINDPERAERIEEQAEHGLNGSYHSEIIEDWREFLNIIRLPKKVKQNIEKEIDICEKFHENNGTLYTLCN